MIFGLERKWFVGDEVWGLETKSIFSANWICVGRIEKLFSEDSDECFRTVQIGEYDLVLIQRADRSVAAFHNTCRHRGTRLVAAESGPIKNSCITCPYHAWTYDAKGCLIGAPNMNEVESFDKTEFGLFPVGCVNWCGFAMIHLSQNADAFESDFAPIIERLEPWAMEQLQLKKTLEYDVKANWKLVFQNYSECYHCPTVHPDLNRLTPYRGASNDLEEGPLLGGPMVLSDDTETVSLDGKLVGNVLPSLSEEQRRLVYYYTLCPTMFISAHPDYVMVHEIHRIDNGSTKVQCHFLAESETVESNLSRAVSQWDEVNQQDWEVCELTQLGINSPAYQPGPYSNLEPMLIAFDRHYRKAMGTIRD